MRIHARGKWAAKGTTFALSLLTGAGLLAAKAETGFSTQSARQSPDWLRRGVIYEVFPRHFSPSGDFNGVTARLDDLADLGVNVLWIMPIHPIGEKLRKGTYGSPYAVKDYYGINPDYGTLDDFKRLVSEAHKRDLKVIMDIVANHTAWDSVMMKHPEFYKQDANHNVIPPVAEWTDVAGLNYDSQELRKYMTEMLCYWVKTCDVDGFRCDVAYMVPTDFWIQARAAVTRLRPDIMFLAEASKPELLVEAFDADYAWPLLGALNDVMTKDAPATRLRDTWEESRRQFPKGSLHMRMSDDHDEARAVARYGIRGAPAASALMFSLDGVPLLYNGMEVGDCTESGDPALFEKLTIFWKPKERSMRPIYQNLIKLRKNSSALTGGTVAWLKTSDEKNVAALMRADDKEEFVTIVNFCNRPVSALVDAKNAPDFQRVRIAGTDHGSGNDFPTCHLKGFEWRIYHRTLKPAVAFKTDSSPRPN
jgi:glycosidase